MKKVTTTITRKTPSMQSTTRSVATTSLPNARGQQQNSGRSTGPSSSQQPQKSRQVSSKTSATSGIAGGGQRTTTQETVTTITQMPLTQEMGQRPRQQQQQERTTYADQQQQRQRQVQAPPTQQAQQARTGIPTMNIPRELPREIAGLAEQQYMQLMDTPPPPPPQLQRQQIPQYGGQRRQVQGQPQQVQDRRRQMQQPQAGSRSGMQQPQAGSRGGVQQSQAGFRCGIQQPQAGSRSWMQQPQAGIRSGMQQPQAGSRSGMQQPRAGSRSGMQQPQAGSRSGMQQPQAGSRSGMQQPQVGFRCGMQPPQAGIRSGMQQPQAGRGNRIQQPQAESRGRMQQPQAGNRSAMQQPQAGSRSRMQPPGYQSRMQQPRDGMAPPARIIATAAPPGLLAQVTAMSPRQAQPVSPRTREFEMIEALSPDTMQEYMTLEQPESRPRRQQAPATDYSDAQYQQLLSPVEQTPRRRRMMQQPGFTSGIPRQIAAAAEEQYMQLLTPEQVKRPSPKAAAPPKSVPSIPTAAVGQPTSLEIDVERALMQKSMSKPGTPFKATGELKRLPTCQESPTRATVQTPTGLKPAETQLLLEGTVKRTATEEIVTRHVVAIEGGMIDEREIVQLTPGKGMKRPKTPESMELIICSSEVKMAAGYRETTSSVIYETTDEPATSAASQLPKSLTPAMLSKLIFEETEDVAKTMKLHPPDLKHSSALTYNIKKRVNALQLNMEDVQELEKSITWPSPRADQTQDEPQPELLASMMHTEERGLAMGSTPEHLYSALFGSDEPMQVEDGTVGVNSVAEHPLNDVVVPAAPAARDLHIAAMTPELANAAINAQNAGAENETIKPSDGAYAERVLGDRKEAMEHVKAKNVAHRDGPPVKYPALFDMEKLAPWEVAQIDAVIKQIGAIPTSILEASVVGPSAVEAADELRDFSVDGIEYLLNMDQVSHQSNIQLRGTQPPSWFPGYYLALGSYRGGSLSIARSPSMVLHAAYNAVQPDMYNDESIISV